MEVGARKLNEDSLECRGDLFDCEDQMLKKSHDVCSFSGGDYVKSVTKKKQMITINVKDHDASSVFGSFLVNPRSKAQKYCISSAMVTLIKTCTSNFKGPRNIERQWITFTSNPESYSILCRGHNLLEFYQVWNYRYITQIISRSFFFYKS